VPTSVEDALRIDRENGNNLWQKALQLEMSEIAVAVKVLDDKEHLPPGYSKASGHI